MACVDLKQSFGHRYRIAHDEAAKYEPGGMNDPWYYIIPCKFGHIYPTGGDYLAFYCTSTRVGRSIQRQIRDQEMEVLSWTADGEGVFRFHVDLFPQIAKFARPLRRGGRKQLSPEEKTRFVEMGRDHRFEGKSTGKSGGLTAQEGAISTEVAKDTGQIGAES